MTEETIRETLIRLQLMKRVHRYMRSTFATDHVGAMNEAFGWTNDSPCGSAMRSLIDTYAAYASVIHRATGDPVPIEQMVDTLLVMVVG